MIALFLATALAATPTATQADELFTRAKAELKAGRRQIGEEFERQPRSAFDDQHVEDGEERNACQNCDDPCADRQHRVAHRPAFGPGVGEIGRFAGCNRHFEICLIGHALPEILRCVRVRRPMPAIFTNRVMARSTRAAYIRASTSAGPASGKWEASNAASVSAGANSDSVT